MIKVNLIGTGRKKSKAVTRIALPTNFVPILLILIVLGFAAAGYWWYTTMNNQVADLDSKINQAETQKAALENVIKQDQIYESRKKALENRVKVIEGLQKNQVSPVVALDQLSEAVERTQYVWLSNLDQNNAILTMSGTGTSLNAIADFYSNLTATGYFKNIDVSNAQD
ncbi:MAG TPA: PilN domain-containing protein, partial [Terriglobia bacterium]|nr:PilN domain-containing protein [Terriglobia bacterium]